jgi:two-component system sensor histidine kinase KdpD
MTDERPDPDTILRRILAENARGDRAGLKIFFGYAPGVGKTYTMLESAQRLRAQGVDVVVGWAETHGRAETAELLHGLEVLPGRAIAYRGTTLKEFDLAGALARRPAVLILDELAHTNAPDGRHRKRWQDVLELLDAGIEVHTTLNVQHVESLNDVVAQITHVQVHETVPDSMLERADEIEVVDISPDELLERLSQGKVYIPDEARRAADHFFRRGNLLALRELTLRRAAERVDEDVRAYRLEHDIDATWPTAERILACVGPSPSSAKIIRGARRIAAGLRASWVATYVEARDAYPMSEDDRARVESHLRLAESLGAEAVYLQGNTVSEEILRYAREHNVTRIVVGKPTHPRWRDFMRGSLVTGIVRGSGDMEIHFIAGDETEAGSPPQEVVARHDVDWGAFAAAAALVAAATVLGVVGRAHLSPADVVMLYVFMIMLAAFRFGRAPSMVAAALSVAAYDFFFVPPYFTFSVEQSRHIVTFAVMFGVGLAVSDLTSRLRRREREARMRERRTAALYSLTRELAGLADDAEASRVIARHAADALGGSATVLLRDEIGALTPGDEGQADVPLSDNVMAVARWAADHACPAGRGTDTLPGALVTCLPLTTGAATHGVLMLRLPSADILDVEHREFLDAFVRQAAIALERTFLSEEARSAALRVRTEEMRSSLLSAVSHDLRTPLAAITGAGTALRDDPGNLMPEDRSELLDTICTEAERMERLITNILDMVRLESGDIVPKREWVPLEEVIGSALSRLELRLGNRDVRLSMPDDLPLAHVDPVLLEHAFMNLIENAVKYAGAESPIEISARALQGALEIELADRGPGFAPGDESRLFEKFYRGPRAQGGGVGLGLAIAKGIVEAHRGSITAANRSGGGATFRIQLPTPETPPSLDPMAGHGAPGTEEAET